MKCPYCQQPLMIPDIIARHLETYHKTINLATPCCQHPIYVSPIFSMKVSVSNTDADHDDWGTRYKSGCPVNIGE